MKYKAPVDENGKEYFVPVVATNKEYLVGYIDGMNDSKEIYSEISEYMNYDINISSGFDVMLNSNKYNDILDIGVRESEMSKKELHDYFFNILNDVYTKINTSHKDNDVVHDEVLNVECSCGFGFYSWYNTRDLPDTTFKCSNCGKILIHYTDEFLYNYDEYDEGEKYDEQKN